MSGRESSQFYFHKPAFEVLEQRLMLSVQSFDIVEMTGAAQTDYTVTSSLIFREGDVANNVTANIVGQGPVATQTDVKSRWDDNSVRQAMVSFVIPTLSASQTITVDIDDGGVNANSDYVTKAELLATNFDANIDVTNIQLWTSHWDEPSSTWVHDDFAFTSSGSVSARDILAGISQANIEYWMQGEIVTEFLIRDLDFISEGGTASIQARDVGGAYHDKLNVQYYVRAYGLDGTDSWNKMRVDTIVENTWTDARSQMSYDFDLEFGDTSPVSRFSRTDLEHNYDARWRKTLWMNSTGADAEPTEIEIQFDVDYMISTGMLPSYDTSLTMTNVASKYSQWQATNTDIMGTSVIRTVMPNTGGREDLGVNPGWVVRYLLTMDNRMREVMLNTADMSGSIPIHTREADPTESFYKKIVNIDDRPTVWTTDWNYSGTIAQDRIPAPIGEIDGDNDGWKYITPGGWQVDRSHQPALNFVPYIVTGDFYYLEEMIFWAGNNLAGYSPYSRNDAEGLLSDTPRGEAWSSRNNSDATFLAPDEFFAAEKTYLNSKLQNTFDNWYNAMTTGYFPASHY